MVVYREREGGNSRGFGRSAGLAGASVRLETPARTERWLPPLFGTYIQCVPSITPCLPNRSLVYRGSVAQSVVRGVYWSACSLPFFTDRCFVFSIRNPPPPPCFDLCRVRTKFIGGATYQRDRPNDRSSVKGKQELPQEGIEGVSADKTGQESPRKNRRQWRIRYASGRVSITARGAFTLPSSLCPCPLIPVRSALLYRFSCARL